MVFEAHQRLKLEGILRGFWLEECVSNDELEDLFDVDTDSSLGTLKLVTHKNFPKIHKVVSDLERKDVKYIAKNAKAFVSLYEGANDTAHMSLRLMWSHFVQREVWSEIRECLYQIGVCALRISRISWDETQANSIENELREALKHLDLQIQGDLSP